MRLSGSAPGESFFDSYFLQFFTKDFPSTDFGFYKPSLNLTLLYNSKKHDFAQTKRKRQKRNPKKKEEIYEKQIYRNHLNYYFDGIHDIGWMWKQCGSHRSRNTGVISSYTGKHCRQCVRCRYYHIRRENSDRILALQRRYPGRNHG